MCPMRVILLFLSALLAGYFAIKTVRAQVEEGVLDLGGDESEAKVEVLEQGSTFSKVSSGISSCFWLVIDMLSGRYLYQNLKGQGKGAEVAT